jgi:hypothetical protein
MYHLIYHSRSPCSIDNIYHEQIIFGNRCAKQHTHFDEHVKKQRFIPIRKFQQILNYPSILLQSIPTSNIRSQFSLPLNITSRTSFGKSRLASYRRLIILKKIDCLSN